MLRQQIRHEDGYRTLRRNFPKRVDTTAILPCVLFVKYNYLLHDLLYNPVFCKESYNDLLHDLLYNPVFC